MVETRTQSDNIRLLMSVQTDLRIRICVLLGGDETMVSDLLQEADVYIWERIDTFDPSRSSFRTWARMMTDFVVRGWQRDAARERRRLVFDSDVFERVANAMAGANASNDASNDDLLAALRHCLGRLAPADRVLVDAHYFDRRPYEELSGQLQTTVGALKVKMFTIRKRLNDCIIGRLCRLTGEGR